MLNENEKKEILNDLYLFYQYFVASKYSDNVDAPHIDQLSQKLTEVYLGEYKRLCVAMPPRHSKTSMVTLAFPLWLIFRNPALNILVVNAEASLSERFGIRLRESVREYGEMFNVYLSDVKHSSSYLMFEDKNGELYQGSIRLVGANGSITGQDADYLIIDDPYKATEGITPSLLEKKIYWFDAIIEQRIEPQTRLIILHTRWHTNDLQGHFQRNRAEDYEFITFPAILPDGTPLWPERYTIDTLRKKQETMGERLFQSIFQQKPIDDSSDFFDLQKIHWYRPDKKIIQSVRGWDIASAEEEQKDQDWTAGVPLYLLEDNSILITDYKYGKFGGETTETVKTTTYADGVDTIQVIETGVAAAGKLLFQEWSKQLRGYFIEQATPVTSKSDRATPLKNKIYDGEVYVDIKDPELRQIFVNEFRAFPLGEHDDIVDATSHAYNYLNDKIIGTALLEVIEL